MTRSWTAVAALALGAVYVPFWLSALGVWPAGSLLTDGLVPGMVPRFADLIVILTGFDCAGPGVDVQRLNPCDPWHRPMNYPRLWLHLEVLGLGPEDSAWLGVAIGAVALAALLAWMAPRSARQALLAVLVLASPPVMLAVERANNDLLVLLLVLAAAVLLARDRASRLLGYVMLYAAFALKLFPLAALGRVLKEPGRLRWVLAVGLGLAVAAYLFLIQDQLRVLAEVVPQVYPLSFGASILPMVAEIQGLLPDDSARKVGLALALPVLAAGAAWGYRRLPRGDALPGRAGVGLELGALIFVGTYLLGSNYDYRLVFPLLCWPAWLALANGADEAWRRVARASLALVAVSYWLTRAWLLIDDLLLLALAFLCAATLAARFAPGGSR